jgi:hypothetical protein
VILELVNASPASDLIGYRHNAATWRLMSV